MSPQETNPSLDIIIDQMFNTKVAVRRRADPLIIDFNVTNELGVYSWLIELNAYIRAHPEISDDPRLRREYMSLGDTELDVSEFIRCLVNANELYPYDEETYIPEEPYHEMCNNVCRYITSTIATSRILCLERRMVDLEKKNKNQVDALDRENILLRLHINSVEENLKEKHLAAMESIHLMCIALLIAMGIIIYII